MKRRHLRHKEEVRVIFALGTVVSLLPRDTILRYLEEVASPYIVKIEMLLSTVPVCFAYTRALYSIFLSLDFCFLIELYLFQNNPEKVEKELAECVEIFTQLFLGLVVKPPDPVFCLLKEALPRFQAVLARYKGQTIINVSVS